MFSSAQAIVLRNSPDLIHITGEETHYDDLYLAGNVVIIDGKVNGNIFVLAKELYVNGSINGDVNAAAQKITLNPQKCYSVRALAGELTSCGNIQKDMLIAIGEKLSICNKNRIRGNLLAAATEADISGYIKGNANVRVGKLKIEALKVSGDLEYMASEVVISENVIVAGQIKVLEKQIEEEINKKMPWFQFIFSKIVSSLYSFLVAYIFGLIWVIFMPIQVSQIVRETIKYPLKFFLIGLSLMIITPVVSMIIAFTFIGIPFAVIGISVLGVGYFMSKIFVAIIIGKLIMEKLFYKREIEPNRKNKHLELIIGLVLLYLIDSIPYLGFWLENIATMAAFGALARTRLDMYKACRQKEIF